MPALCDCDSLSMNHNRCNDKQQNQFSIWRCVENKSVGNLTDSKSANFNSNKQQQKYLRKTGQSRLDKKKRLENHKTQLLIILLAHYLFHNVVPTQLYSNRKLKLAHKGPIMFCLCCSVAPRTAGDAATILQPPARQELAKEFFHTTISAGNTHKKMCMNFTCVQFHQIHLQP